MCGVDLEEIVVVSGFFFMFYVRVDKFFFSWRKFIGFVVYFFNICGSDFDVCADSSLGEELRDFAFDCFWKELAFIIFDEKGIFFSNSKLWFDKFDIDF